MERIEITKDAVLQPGDRIEIEFRTIGPTWLKAAQLALIQNRLEKRPEYEIRNWEVQGNKIIIGVQIKQPAESTPGVQYAGVSAALIINAVVVVAAGALIWLSLETIYKIVESPAGKIAVTGVGTMAIAAGITALLAILSRK